MEDLPLNRNDLKNIVKEAIEERENCELCEFKKEWHAKHHRYVDRMIAKEERRTELVESMKKTFFGWLLVTVTIGLGTAVYHYAVTIVQHMKK